MGTRVVALAECSKRRTIDDLRAAVDKEIGGAAPDKRVAAWGRRMGYIPALGQVGKAAAQAAAQDKDSTPVEACMGNSSLIAVVAVVVVEQTRMDCSWETGSVAERSRKQMGDYRGFQSRTVTELSAAVTVVEAYYTV